MKKPVLFMACLLFTWAAYAQDSIQNGTVGTRQTTMHKKHTQKHTVHHETNTTSVDSVSAGRVTTNPEGKKSGKSSNIKTKTTKKSTGS